MTNKYWFSRKRNCISDNGMSSNIHMTVLYVYMYIIPECETRTCATAFFVETRTCVTAFFVETRTCATAFFVDKHFYCLASLDFRLISTYITIFTELCCNQWDSTIYPPLPNQKCINKIFVACITNVCLFFIKSNLELLILKLFIFKLYSRLRKSMVSSVFKFEHCNSIFTIINVWYCISKQVLIFVLQSSWQARVRPIT